MALFAFFPAYLQRRWLISVGVLVVLAVAQVWLWVWVRGAAGEWFAMRAERQDVIELTKRLSTLQAEQTEGQQALTALDSLVPPQDRSPKLIEDIERLAESRGLSLKIQSIVEEPGRTLVPLVLTMTISGDPDALIAFFDKLERLSYVTIIRQWSMTVGAEELKGPPSEFVPYTLRLTSAFYLKSLEPNPSNEPAN